MTRQVACRARGKEGAEECGRWGCRAEPKGLGRRLERHVLPLLVPGRRPMSLVPTKPYCPSAANLLSTMMSQTLHTTLELLDVCHLAFCFSGLP